MFQRNFKDESFEDYLKQNADGLKMRPSEKAWKSIEKKLKKSYRWTNFVASAFLLTASLFGFLSTDLTKTPAKPVSATADNQEVATPEPSSGKVIPITQHQKNTTGLDQHTTGLPVRSQKDLTPLIALNTNIGNRHQQHLFTNEGTPAPEDAAIDAVDNKEVKINGERLQKKYKSDEPLAATNETGNYKPAVKQHKMELMLFFTPTVSYRKLSENKSYLRSLPNNSFSYASFYDVQNVVTHKPDIGLELGFSLKYRVAKALKIRSGLQLTLNGYDIKASDAVPEAVTITLNSRSRIDSISTVTSYRNSNNANNNDWIRNSYFQISAPIGLEATLYGNKKMQLGVAGTIQPTYIIGDRAYLISNDYKSYAQVPSLTRHWNMNTALETFIAYPTGKLKWQIGPQIRYQLLSSFVEKYPVKENLIDFGVKIGVSLNNK